MGAPFHYTYLRILLKCEVITYQDHVHHHYRMNTRPNPHIYLAGQIHFIGFGPNPNLYSLRYPDNGLGPNPNLYPIKLSKIGAQHI